ncbi:hypothetical protein M4D49_29090 [Cupriavidus pauculus]|uniref:type IV CRISPR-associated protein Csf3 n=1 Tax=Cupriavidus TaxID=106589 RepID=UPI0004937B7F|nr:MULTISPECIES: type IV CRISPR-associated protein Csf3 [Cupriavidus]MCM3609534.1 hypothetical protein [Cupriavidus pauculus]
MTPLRLTWRLSTPMATSGYPIHLDDLVAFAKTRMELRMAGYGEEGLGSSIRDLARVLPLEREERPEGRVWKASALVPADNIQVTHGMRFWTKKTDPFDYASRFDQGHLAIRTKRENMKPYALKIDTQRGLLKNGFKFFTVKHVPVLQAWCVGDEEALRELLDPACGSPLMWIGARGRSGLGRISAFEMVRDEAAFDLWQRRTLPWAYEGATELELATEPPYWEPANRRLAWIDPSLIM